MSVDQQALEHRQIELIRAGNKIRAIKELRDERRLSLKDAKDVVEALERN
ncbi:ribosomal protein L7/L12 [Paenibacillus hubeiensis]